MLILDMNHNYETIFSHAPCILLPEWLAPGRSDTSPLSGHPRPPRLLRLSRLPRMLLILPRLFQKKGCPACNCGPHATLRLHVPHATAAPATRPCMLVRLRMELCASCLLMPASCLQMRMQVGTATSEGTHLYATLANVAT
jgi:hypothetical protein